MTNAIALPELQIREGGKFRSREKDRDRADGEWFLEGKIWQLTDGRICFSFSYLEEKYGDLVPVGSWVNWVRRRPCPDLDPAINDGFIRSFLVPSPSAFLHVTGQQDMRVVLQEDVKRIVERRNEGANRSRAPGIAGEWIVDDVLWLNEEFGVCATDRKIVTDAARDGDAIAMDTLSNWRRHPKKALGGRPAHWHRVPKVEGRGKVFVTCLADIKKIFSERKRIREQPTQQPKGWLIQAEIYELLIRRKLGGQFSNFHLAFVLKAFRAEQPASFEELDVWDKKLNGSRSTKYHDPNAFISWLAGRDIRQVAAPLIAAMRRERRRAGGKGQRFLERAKAYLLFILTDGHAIESKRNQKKEKRFALRVFNRFCENLRPGRRLEPRADGQLSVDIQRWAKEIGISLRAVDDAKADLRVEHFKKKDFFQGPTYCRLPRPVTIPAPTNCNGATPPRNGEPSTPNGTATTPAARPAESTKYPGHFRKPYTTGRHSDPETEESLEFCYDELIGKGRLRVQVLNASRLMFPNNAPSNEPNVRNYARRWAKRFEPPLPL